GAADAAVTRLRGFVADLAKVRRKRTYPSVEAAAARVRENNSGLSERAAFHLALYGTQPLSSGGVEFTFDPAHRWRFGFSSDEEQILAILAGGRSKWQGIHGSQGITLGRPH